MSRVVAHSVIAAAVDAVVMRQAGAPVWAIEHALVVRHGLTEPTAQAVVGRALRRLVAVREAAHRDAQPRLDAAALWGDCMPVRWAHPVGRS